MVACLKRFTAGDDILGAGHGAHGVKAGTQRGAMHPVTWWMGGAAVGL